MLKLALQFNILQLVLIIWNFALIFNKFSIISLKITLFSDLSVIQNFEFRQFNEAVHHYIVYHGLQGNLQSNEQSLHVGALWVIFMTGSRNGDKQICSI